MIEFQILNSLKEDLMNADEMYEGMSDEGKKCFVSKLDREFSKVKRVYEMVDDKLTLTFDFTDVDKDLLTETRSYYSISVLDHIRSLKVSL